MFHVVINFIAVRNSKESS